MSGKTAGIIISGKPLIYIIRLEDVPEYNPYQSYDNFVERIIGCNLHTALGARRSCIDIILLHYMPKKQLYSNILQYRTPIVINKLQYYGILD